MNHAYRFSPLWSVLALVLLYVIALQPATAQYPGSGQLPLNPKSIPKFVDPLPHFAGDRIDATTLGTPLTVTMLPTNQQALSTGTILPNGTIVGPTTGLTHVWGYQVSNGTKERGPHWPTWTIEAKKGVPLNVMYLNNINESYNAVNLTVDQTLHWAMMTTGTTAYTGPVPAIVHLHGGEVPAWSDGGPDAWYTPGGLDGGHAAMTNVYYYPNTQEAATLWFHDHALGVTRLNVYAGMAGFYFLRDNEEDGLHLPGWSGDGTVQQMDRVTGRPVGAPYLPEIEVAIQDRMFDQNGQLYFPAGALVAPNPTVHPFWVPEFVGNIITVNGMTWPYLSVAPRKYRFRVLNGSNARFYELWLQDLATAAMGPIIYQIGTDGGLLDAPVAINPALGGKLLLGPGERADIIIDFSGSAPNQVWTLKNSGNTPYPKGAPPNGSTLGQIMQFVVNGTTTADNSAINGRLVPLEKLANFATGTAAVPFQKRRVLTLNEVMGMGGPLEILVNNTKWDGHSTRTYNDFTAFGDALYSEVMKEGETEVWQIVNLTADTHPMHLHLVQYQLVSRQKFNVNNYNKAYSLAYPQGVSPVDGLTYGPGVFIPGWGPPKNYNTFPNGAAAIPVVGGNPDVTPFLQGPAQPAKPNERGWKDTFVMNPGEVTTVIARWAPTDKPAAALPANLWFDAFNPNGGHGYVWHCHIVDHEDNEMMRPYSVTANTNAPAGRITAPAYAGYKTTHPDAPAAAAQANLESPELSLEAVDAGLPASFGLSQNYPNPFNPSTEIRFSLPEATHVTLTLYNNLGQEVKTLIDSDAPAGFHTAKVDGRGLSSGIYYYRIQAGSFTDVKSMILLK